jgi:hypothetical protein
VALDLGLAERVGHPTNPTNALAIRLVSIIIYVEGKKWGIRSKFALLVVRSLN